MINSVALIAAIVIIVGLAVFGLCVAKKGGKKCVGCPDNCTCGQNHNHNGSCENNNQ